MPRDTPELLAGISPMFRPPLVRYPLGIMNANFTSQDLLEIILHRTTALLHRVTLKAGYFGHKRRAREFARRVH